MSTNISKKKRDKMISFLNKLKKINNDDDAISAINEIESFLINKKYGLVWEEHEDEITSLLKTKIPILIEDEDKIITTDLEKKYNFIIEGDNLQALNIIEKTHRGKLDLIYIDPPYNTGARDWKYNNDYVDSNDVYRHSKWLSMMKDRLIIAKKLLNPEDSVLICTIDEKEYLHLGCLIEELFPTARIQMISSVINPAGAGRSNDFARTDEYIFFVQLGSSFVLPESRDLEDVPIVWDTLRRSNAKNTRDKTNKQFYAIYVNKETGLIEEIGDPLPKNMPIEDVPARDNCVSVFPIRDNGIEMMWGCSADELRTRLSEGFVRAGKYTPDKPQKYVISYVTGGVINDIKEGKAIVTGYNPDGSVIAHFPNGRDKMPTTNWNRPSHDAQRYGTGILKKIFGNRFTFPKSLYAVADCMRFFLANKKDALVLDFFAGSGTTGHAVCLLNAEDGGNRKFIMVTNNEISDEEEKKLSLEGFKKGDEEWEKLGIAQYVTYPRMKCVIEGKDINGKKLEGEYISSSTKNLLFSSGFKENLKYYKCDWIDRKPDDYFLHPTLCKHVKEMIELENHIDLDNEKYILLLNKNDIEKYIIKNDKKDRIKRIWLNENIIINNEELDEIKKYNFSYIPRNYYYIELMEVGE